MSVRMMSRVWADQTCRPLEKLVLLAFADFCDDAGYCWPKVPAVAKKTGLSVRQVQRILARYKSSGTISVQVASGRGHASRYKLNLEKGDSQSPRQKRVTGAAERVTGEKQKGDWLGNAIKEEPSGTVIEPSVLFEVRIPTVHPEEQKQHPLSQRELYAERLNCPPQQNCELCGGLGLRPAIEHGMERARPCQCRSANQLLSETHIAPQFGKNGPRGQNL
jgi:hypothetical protein